MFSALGENAQLASTLVNMADIQQTEKDYIGSEATAIRGIKVLQSLPKTESNLNRLWILNNLLAVISGELLLLDDAIDYHNKALAICDKMDYGIENQLYSKNNLAFVYREKEDYEKALALYYEVLDTKNLFTIDPPFYALILDNIAYTRFLLKDPDEQEILKLFHRANKISDSLSDTWSQMAVSIDLARFYQHKKEKDSALYYVNKTYEIAKATSTNNVILETLLLKAELEDGDLAKTYLNEHIKLNDSLLNNERAIRNKFAKIKFNTEEIELKNKQISRQKLWLMIFSGILIVTLFLLYIIITQRARNKELKFIQQQQETNEEIYNLMLSQQDKIDEGRAQEKRRISEELHDGILGRLFGTRLSLDSLNMSTTPEAIETRNNYISELKTIEEDIRKVSHDLNTDFVAGSGYVDIIQTLVDNQTKAYGLKYELLQNDDINWDDVSNKTKIHFYRIIQESLQNIYKHANAKSVKISFKLKNNVICLSISDDGSGFDIHKAKKGIGIKNITSRANEIQSELDITSEKGVGTTITIKTPIKN
jgi:signal transduction histidine kinase